MTNAQFNRRDFLKLLSLIPPAYHMPKNIAAPETASQQNIIILVFDAWSANNISLYGYPRKTMPFLEKLADKAIVYHNHYAASGWTFPATTGLLTGVHSWTNRALNQTRPYPETFAKNNIFKLFENRYRIGYTQNQIADRILRAMSPLLQTYLPHQDLYLLGKDKWMARLFQDDFYVASTAWVRTIKKFYDGYANSLFLSRLYGLHNRQLQAQIEHISSQYPLGLPVIEVDNHFDLEKPLNWINKQTQSLPQPYIGYFHMLPPHDPYSPRIDVYDTFLDDGYIPIKKPEHLFSSQHKYDELVVHRKNYDEYILLVDTEINRFYHMLEENNVLDNTWLIITADHGEMLERGILGHLTPAFHNPHVHIPLLIFPPGQQERIDIHTPTSAIDVLPTLLHLTGNPIPDWLEGQLLPPYLSNPDPQRNIFSMDAFYSPQNGPFTDATMMLRKGNYKLTYFFGTHKKYEDLNGNEKFELYNLQNDPEELDNLVKKEP